MMTNKERIIHLSNNLLFQGYVFENEARRYPKFLSEIPNFLYKYKEVNKDSIDMLKNEYVFLSMVKDLDDPFDCVANIDMNEIYKNEAVSVLSKEMVSYIAVCIKQYVDSYSKEQLLRIINASVKNGSFNEECICKALGPKSQTLRTEEHLIFLILRNFENVLGNIANDKEGVGEVIYKATHADTEVGLGALSELRDNKVMWSLYGGKYEGICIEYQIPKERNYIVNLCPVVYKRYGVTNIYKRLVEFTIASCVHYVPENNKPPRVGALTELFCTKDTDWSYQREWRIIGDPLSAIPTKIKSVYLGFKISKENEEKVVNIAKENKFNVYKMNNPNGKTKISYTKIL